MAALMALVLRLEEARVSVVMSQRGIHPQVSQRCVERGIVAIERVSARHIHRLAEITAAEVLGCWDEEVGASALGYTRALTIHDILYTHEHSLYTIYDIVYIHKSTH
jgi:hypothetical protein